MQLAFNTATAGLPGCAPEVYAALPQVGTDGLDLLYAPPPGSSRDAMTVLGEEILKGTGGTGQMAMPPTWLLTVGGRGSVRVQDGGEFRQ